VFYMVQGIERLPFLDRFRAFIRSNPLLLFLMLLNSFLERKKTFSGDNLLFY